MPYDAAFAAAAALPLLPLAAVAFYFAIDYVFIITRHASVLRYHAFHT